MKIHISSVALFKRGIYFERNSGDRAEVCGLALCMLDVLLALMAAGLAEGRTEKGARGGGGPETERGGPGVPSTDTAADKQESHRLQKQPVPQTDPVEDGRTDGAVGLFLFMSYRGVLPLTAAEGVRLQAAWV